MELKKAIELGTYSLKHNTILITQGDRDALKLLIEAGERLQQLRLSRITWFRGLLPGETVD